MLVNVVILVQSTPNCRLYYIELFTALFRNKQPEERICPICNTGVEDEFHFVFICEEYSHFREILYAKVVNVEFNVVSKKKSLYI